MSAMQRRIVGMAGALRLRLSAAGCWPAPAELPVGQGQTGADAVRAIGRRAWTPHRRAAERRLHAPEAIAPPVRASPILRGCRPARCAA